MSGHCQLTAELSRSESVRPSDREQGDQALSSKTTPVLPTAASQLPPVKLFVCLCVCGVSVDAPSFFESLNFSASITGWGNRAEGKKIKLR